MTFLVSAYADVRNTVGNEKHNLFHSVIQIYTYASSAGNIFPYSVWRTQYAPEMLPFMSKKWLFIYFFGGFVTFI